jgi:3alpha(or 20beta)-hydroxysteroid dehydrogenase
MASESAAISDGNRSGAPRLAERTILVSGGAGGLGAAQSALFVRHGANVVVADRRLGDVESVVAGLGRRAVGCALDVREPDAWSSAVRFAEEAFDCPVTGMVNNAAISGGSSTVLDTALGRYQDVIAVNQVGAFLGIQASALAMVRAGGGAIVTVSSILGYAGHPRMSSYTSTKFAVRGLTRVAALELAASGVRVNCVCPGAVDTPMLRLGSDDPSVLGPIANQVPQRKVAQPSQIAEAVLFLISDESRYVTGTDLVIDGGLSARIPLDLAAR